MFKKLAKKILFPIVDFIINSGNRVIKAKVKFLVMIFRKRCLCQTFFSVSFAVIRV